MSQPGPGMLAKVIGTETGKALEARQLCGIAADEEC